MKIKIKKSKIYMTIFWLVFALFICGVVFAEETTSQTVKNDQAYATLNIQKQPQKDNKQAISNHFTFFTINVQINGKLDDIPTDKK